LHLKRQPKKLQSVVYPDDVFRASNEDVAFGSGSHSLQAWLFPLALEWWPINVLRDRGVAVDELPREIIGMAII
jgi:hypothetical protein